MTNGAHPAMWNVAVPKFGGLIVTTVDFICCLFYVCSCCLFTPRLVSTEAREIFYFLRSFHLGFLQRGHETGRPWIVRRSQR